MHNMLAIWFIDRIIKSNYSLRDLVRVIAFATLNAVQSFIRCSYSNRVEEQGEMSLTDQLSTLLLDKCKLWGTLPYNST